MRRARGSPHRLRAAVAVLAIATASLALAPAASAPPAAAQEPANGWYIDADTLHVRDADEEGMPWDDGDEPLFAVVAFRTKIGEAGSTDAWRLGGFRRLCSGADDGATCAIPDVTGRAHFGPVATLTPSQIRRGRAPELIGTIQLTVEEDETPRNELNSELRRLETVMEQELAAVSEPSSPDTPRLCSEAPNDLACIAELASTASGFAGIANRIQGRTELNFWRSAHILITSYTNPSNTVDYRITAMVGLRLEPEERDRVNAALQTLLTPTAEVRGCPQLPPGAGPDRRPPPCSPHLYRPEQKTAAAVLDPYGVTHTHTASGITYVVGGSVHHVGPLPGPPLRVVPRPCPTPCTLPAPTGPPIVILPPE